MPIAPRLYKTVKPGDTVKWSFDDDSAPPALRDADGGVGVAALVLEVLLALSTCACFGAVLVYSARCLAHATGRYCTALGFPTGGILMALFGLAPCLVCATYSFYARLRKAPSSCPNSAAARSKAKQRAKHKPVNVHEATMRGTHSTQKFTRGLAGLCAS